MKRIKVTDLKVGDRFVIQPKDLAEVGETDPGPLEVYDLGTAQPNYITIASHRVNG